MKNVPVRFSTYSGWMFVLLWLLAYFVGGMLYVLPVSAVQFLLRLDGFSDVQHVAEANRAFVVFATSSVAAACGLSIAFFQWLVLRREFQGIRSWIAATTLGFASLGILPLIAGILRPDWPAWAFTLILDGKFHWLARVMPDWPLAAWLPGAVTLTMFGAVLGILQWIVLRKHCQSAAYWILISTAGWAAGASSTLVQNGRWDVLATWAVPVLVPGVGLAWLK
jgi:hypothetical protein